jgi:hypothetical protein
MTSKTAAPSRCRWCRSSNGPGQQVRGEARPEAGMMSRTGAGRAILLGSRIAALRPLFPTDLPALAEWLMPPPSADGARRRGACPLQTRALLRTFPAPSSPIVCRRMRLGASGAQLAACHSLFPVCGSARCGRTRVAAVAAIGRGFCTPVCPRLVATRNSPGSKWEFDAQLILLKLAILRLEDLLSAVLVSQCQGASVALRSQLHVRILRARGAAKG